MSKTRIIAINRDNNRIKKLKIFAHCLEIHSPKQITINPVQNLKVQTHLVFPDNLVGIFIPQPDIEKIQAQMSEKSHWESKIMISFY